MGDPRNSEMQHSFRQPTLQRESSAGLETIHITAASDENMAAGLGIGLFSIFRRSRGPIHAWIVLDRVSDVHVKRFETLGRQFGHQITFVEPTFREEYSQAKRGSHVNQVTYYRLNAVD
jgi:lipopolysaccharide biosynthesis glycosyltransferase